MDVKENKIFLKSLASASRYRRKVLLSKATPKQLKAIQQICFNVQQEVVPLNKHQIYKLVKGGYRKSIKEAGNKKTHQEARRKLLIQRGGFLQYLIPAALSYLQSYL